jgi:DNA modification methylase
MTPGNEKAVRGRNLCTAFFVASHKTVAADSVFWSAMSWESPRTIADHPTGMGVGFLLARGAGPASPHTRIFTGFGAPAQFGVLTQFDMEGNMAGKRKSDLDHIAEQLRPLAVDIADLVLDPANARKHPEANIEAIKGSLAVYGQRKPLVVNRRTRAVEAGNGTLEAARDLGWKKIAVVFVDDDPATAAGFSIADNRTAELATWDQEALDKLLREVRSDDERLQQMLEELARDQRVACPAVEEGLTDPDAIPAPPDEATTKPGDLWVLGNHRLLCGDSSKPEDVDRLLDGSAVHLINTDPPYNVKVEPRSNNAIAAGLSSFQGNTHHQGLDVARHPEKAKPTSKKLRPKDRPLVNDFVSEEEFERLLKAWFGNMARVLEPGRGFYIWGGYANCANYPPVLKTTGLYFSQAVIWVKEHPVLTRKDFMGNHEWCFYGWREGAAHQWLGPTNATDVWSIKKVNPQSMVHLTEKPVELAVRAMEYSSRAGENVLDLFGGSGSTLIAAQQTGRKAYLMELDPLYCDVIVKRWEQFTGNEAKVAA